ncbi:hypothetical protein L249_3891 [Ophiocordyceps polyrhachis-furcata BCC 54312]|uniref:Uncharacterized protein n=1 Tax=Ophiocordyceps polyrhachis-furcata BCC 54312 TaxID=1330021 RepID=A0A367L5V5_9HYPO|nr:hypothetical protein L249_3891 [Ophiocordyceps polyrhachis-furcata BCC 54312]
MDTTGNNVALPDPVSESGNLRESPNSSFPYSMPGAFLDDEDNDDDNYFWDPVPDSPVREEEEEEEEEEEDEDADFNDDNDEDDDDDDYEDDVVEDDEEDEEDDDGMGQDDPDPQQIMGLFRDGEMSGLLTRGQLMALLRHRNFSHALFNGADEADVRIWGGRAYRNPHKDPNRFPKVPSDEGRKLMRDGTFGANNIDSKTLARRMLERELALGDGEQRRQNNDIVTQSLIPGTRADQIVHYDQPVYSGQFSDDGNFFFSCSQDFKVRMYDTSNPFEWKHYKTVSYPWGQWTLTDASLSPDNRWLAYTSIQSIVSIAPTDPSDTGDPYTLALDGNPQTHDPFQRGQYNFGIWSIRFSGDGRELVAGTSTQSIVVYDIQSRTVLHHILGHSDDVNAVCFADKASPHIIYSGSDDSLLKVWDRRSMGDGREAGAFVGHLEGLTYIDSKGDGRYILSNGKDQSMKLWDLRMAKSSAQLRSEMPLRLHPHGNFDYRRQAYDEDDWEPHPHDNSLVTFRGHKVLRTLIRCHFSPPSSTNSRYVYSGSADGKVYIWNIDATPAGIIDVKKATTGTRRHDRHTRRWYDEPGGWDTCVRDASWHPSAPVLVASAWNGYSMARGTCTLHSFDEAGGDESESAIQQSLDCNLRPNPDVYFSTGNEYMSAAR